MIFWDFKDLCVCFGVEGGFLSEDGNGGLDQSKPLGNSACLPDVMGSLHCLEIGSWLGSFTIDTKVPVPSDGRLRFLIESLIPYESCLQPAHHGKISHPVIAYSASALLN